MADLLEYERIHTAFLIGPHFKVVETRHRKFASFEEFRDAWMQLDFPRGSLILLKGSRGMALEYLM